MFTVHVSTKPESDQTLSSCSQKNINKLFNANTKGLFLSLRANSDTLKQQVKHCGECVFDQSGWVTYQTFTVPPTREKKKGLTAIQLQMKVEWNCQNLHQFKQHTCSRASGDCCDVTEQCIVVNVSCWINIDNPWITTWSVLFSPTWVSVPMHSHPLGDLSPPPPGLHNSSYDSRQSESK